MLAGRCFGMALDQRVQGAHSSTPSPEKLYVSLILIHKICEYVMVLRIWHVVNNKLDMISIPQQFSFHIDFTVNTKVVHLSTLLPCKVHKLNFVVFGWSVQNEFSILQHQREVFSRLQRNCSQIWMFSSALQEGREARTEHASASTAH